MLVHHRVTPSIKFASTQLYTWVERGTVRVKCLAQEHSAMSLGQGSNPDLLDLKTSTLTMRPLHLPQFLLWTGIYFFIVFFFCCSDLFGIDMSNPSLAERSPGNGHVSLAGEYSIVHILLGIFLLMPTAQDFNRKHRTVIIMQAICILHNDIHVECIYMHKVNVHLCCP